MNKRQLTALFLCSLVPWTVGNGLCPLLPAYATRLGADSTVAGLYFASFMFAMALGTISAGRVSGSRYRRRLPIIFAGSASVPLAWLMGQANSMWALALLTALLWYSFGLALGLVSVLTGMSAGEDERGKVFGILALTCGGGAVVGGLGTGWLADHWGYPIMFSANALFSLLLPSAAWFLEEEEDRSSQHEGLVRGRAAPLGRNYYLLFAANVLANITICFLYLIRSLAMSDLGFGPLEISSTGVVGGLISLPVPVLMGWLSDRIGRKDLLLVAYLAAFPALVVLAFSNALWHFWLVFVFYGLVAESSTCVGNAWVTDLLPPESLGKGLALYGSTLWIGAVIGFAVSGYALQNLGPALTYLIGGLLALGAVGLLMPIKARVGQVRLSQA